MVKIPILFLLFLFPVASFADVDDVVSNATVAYEAIRVVCSGVADEIGRVANISKANTAVSVVGTVAAGGALVAGITKSKEEEEIDRLIEEMCNAGGCSAEGVEAMSNAEFFENVLQPMAQIAELQEHIEKSKQLGNWRTGLLAGTIGTNLASAIMSGINTNQSDLIQRVTACNEMIEAIPDIEIELKKVGANPMEHNVMKKLSNARTWCKPINISDIEKIENRMKGVMGTSVAGVAIGAVGVGTSAAANSNKYMDMENKIKMSNKDKRKEQALNTTANVMSGANIATGAVETGLNISLITLTKKLMASAQRCEDVLR